jgi:hypothetical protein
MTKEQFEKTYVSPDILSKRRLTKAVHCETEE